MGYITLLIALVLSVIAWRRILQKQDHWALKLVYFVITAVPIAGPIFYLMIDPPESTPPAVDKEDFWECNKTGGKVWPSYRPLITSLSHWFKYFK